MCWRRDVRACHASRLRCSNKRHLAESEFTHGRYASIDAWLREAKADPSFRACGMYLVHNGTVRETPKAEARGIETDGVQPGDKVTSMHFSYDEDKVAAAVEEARTLPGIGTCAYGSTPVSLRWATTSCSCSSAATSARV